MEDDTANTAAHQAQGSLAHAYRTAISSDNLDTHHHLAGRLPSGSPEENVVAKGPHEAHKRSNHLHHDVGSFAGSLPGSKSTLSKSAENDPNTQRYENNINDECNRSKEKTYLRSFPGDLAPL